VSNGRYRERCLKAGLCPKCGHEPLIPGLKIGAKCKGRQDEFDFARSGRDRVGINFRVERDPIPEPIRNVGPSVWAALECLMDPLKDAIREAEIDLAIRV